ncbi:helix-turn-helix domain-containing protein [Garciella nitratireducens]|uniref:helix-turn-helix domain-containing protein n=1 Tax=Garciella nitratireducens TaxID=218205 RepID=UPI000DEADDEE|nr:helix-turn-helix transcriptional regulator [Garciella nitratireducens]RBP44971.1 transcriptional regulator with XRE-family HTH domain [Garciella nitratireducens]
MDTIGQRIRYARKLSNLTISDVSKMTGLSPGNLSELENDKFAPSAHSLIAFRKAFHVHIDWILTGNPPIYLEECDKIQEEQPPYLTQQEKKLLEAFWSLDEEKKRDILGYINVVMNLSKKDE